MATQQEQLTIASGAESAVLERRAVPRHRILRQCLVWPGSRGLGGWRCIAYDVSATGLGMTLPLPVQAGTVLEIEAWGLAGTRPRRARVVRCVPVEFLWFCGCEFLDPLGEDELQAWRKGASGQLSR